VGSALELIPGVGSLMKRWYAGAGDAGVMFSPDAFVTLAGYKIQLPVDIALSARRVVNVRTNDGLRDSIKQLTPTVTMDITLGGRSGNWRKATLPPIPTLPVIGGAAATVTGVVGTLLGTSELVATTEILGEIFGTLRKAEAPVTIEDADGVLADLGVYAAVPLSFDMSPIRPGYTWTMGLLWDLDEDPVEVLFPTEEETGG